MSIRHIDLYVNWIRIYMHTLSDLRIDLESAGGELQAACEHIVRELIEGVRHGFFEMNVKVEIMQSKKTRITVMAGKSHRFVV
jgi:hypothetical protein